MQAKVSLKLLSLMSSVALWRRRYSGYGGKTPAAFEKSQRSPIRACLALRHSDFNARPSFARWRLYHQFYRHQHAQKAEQALKDANVSLEQRVQESSQRIILFNRAFNRSQCQQNPFLAASGHDLMQPINAAKLFASTLSQQNLTQQQQPLHYLEGSLQSAEDVLSTLVEISKLDADAIVPVIQPLFFTSVLKPLKMNLPHWRRKNLHLRTRYGDNWVLGDAHWLRRIIQNLLANAALQRARRYFMACRRRGDFLYVEVWDSGVGIPKDKLKDIFQEFKRLDHKIKTRKVYFGFGYR